MTSKSVQAVPAALAVVVLSLLAFVPSALASKVISEAGKGAGQTRGPNGVAVDFETGGLYVADTKNNRVDVFSPTGAFERAFGWGVKDGEGKFEVCTTSCREGLSGSGAGEFDEPTGIAVDNSPSSSSRHDVYVVDSANSRIEKFTPEGEFKLAFGSAGEGEGQFSRVASIAGLSNFFVGVGPGGTVYVLDSLKAGSEFEQRLQKFEPSGTVIAPQHVLYKDIFSAFSLAVDSTGDFYVNAGFNIRKYDAGGGFVREIQNAFEGTFEGAPAISVEAIAVGAEDNLFTVSAGISSGASVMEFDSAGNRLRRFGYGSVRYVAKAIVPSPEPRTGGIYVGEAFNGDISEESEGRGSRVVQVDLGPAGPVVFPAPCNASPLGSVKATLNAEVNPEGKVTTVHFQYITDADFVANGDSFSGAHPTTSTAESGSVGSDFTLHKASAEARLEPETKYHCRAVATNADAPAGIDGEEGAFLSKEPFEFLEISAGGVGIETATLNATVNPFGASTSGYFEYVDDATYEKDVAELGPGHGFDHAGRAPDGPEELDFGASEEPKVVSAPVSGLLPGTLYHFRIRVDDHLSTVPPRSGPEGSFRTFASFAGLPDGRAWELVSPAQKNGAEVAVPRPAGGLTNPEIFVPINAAAGSGEAVTYTSWTSFGSPEGAQVASQYLSKRTASGWGTENISPFASAKHPLSLPYRGFTSDLRFGAFVTSEPPLTSEAQVGFENLYLRDNQTGVLDTLTIEEPQVVSGPFNGFCSGYAGASADGTHAIFSGRGAMAGAPIGAGFSLYEWSVAKGLSLVSVLPDGELALPVKVSEAPREGTGFGAVGGSCSMDQAPVRHTISEDGSTIFWTYGGKYKGAEHPLFARLDGAETVQLDAKPEVSPGKGPFGEGKFWAATGDGSMAFFTAPGKLTKDAGAVGQFYRYDTRSRSLIDLTPGETAPQIEGVIGASEDGAYTYFVAAGALTGEQESATHQKALQGANNLYVWHEGEGVRFIARLSALDQFDWSTAPEQLTARLTPDGRHLAFLSIEAEALSGNDNTIVSGGHCKPSRENNTLAGDPHCPEVYLYDAEAAVLTCASCNPSGSRPIGPATLPAWSNPYEGPRYLSDDGSRVFFESRDVLSAADQNNRRDVYEFERPGAGSCTSDSPAFDAASGGCIFLISSGKSTDETFFIDASADGRDVFFSTRQPLTGWDTNENYDVYDARVGGGFAEPSTVASCEGEACKPPPIASPSVIAPATLSFQGQGNAVQTPVKSKPVKPRPKKPKSKKKKLKKESEKKSKHKASNKHKRATAKKRRTGR
jgi:DNA-binding beta-propeller fold protein YncE